MVVVLNKNMWANFIFIKILDTIQMSFIVSCDDP